MADDNILEIGEIEFRNGRKLIRDLKDEIELDYELVVPIMGTTDVVFDKLGLRYRMKKRYNSWKLSGDIGTRAKHVIDIMSKMDEETTQRDLYYAVRGAHPKNESYRGDEAYNKLIQTIIPRLEGRTEVSRESLGLVAGARGFIGGIGTFNTPSRGVVDCKAKPTINYELVEPNSSFSPGISNKLFIIEDESTASKLVKHDFPKMLEFTIMTSQGYLVRAARRFASICEGHDMRVFSLNDADTDGFTMAVQLLTLTKDSSYLGDGYRTFNNKIMGVLPRVAIELGLPSESVKNISTLDNLYNLIKGTGLLIEEFNEGLVKDRQWEIQAFSALHNRAIHAYIIECMRVGGVPAKYVPDAEEVKRTVDNSIRSMYNTESMIRNELEYAIKSKMPKIRLQIKEMLSEKLTGMTDIVTGDFDDLSYLDNLNSDEYYNSVMKKLYQHPDLTWKRTLGGLINEIISAEMNIEFDVEVDIKLTNVKITGHRKISQLEESDDKYDLYESIERKLNIPQDVCKKIREALEKYLKW